MVTIHESHPPITEADIQTVEQELKVKFPDDYRRFLLAHNGGRPEPNYFEMFDDGLAFQDSMVAWFYCIDPTSDSHLARWYRLTRNRMPSEFIPIGCDPGGNKICLVVSGDDRGMIFFWDHESEMDEDEPPTYDNLFFIADSMDDLLNNRLMELP